jgi:hypothetical protein
MTYNPGAHHCYQAGVDATLLADVDPVQYRQQLVSISDYLVNQQLPNGGWDYPSGRQGHGDTSVVQYACLGLWAANRAGIDVPQSVWQKSLEWHLSTQQGDGGFTYVPNSKEGYTNGGPSLNMTCAALSSIMIAARHAYPGRADDLSQLMQLPKETAAAGGASSAAEESALQRIDLSRPDTPVEAGTPAGASVSLDIGRVRDMVRRALGWVGPRFVPIRTDGQAYRAYYFYTAERMGSLLNVETIGSVPWYDACSTALLKIQQPDGSWTIMTEWGTATRDTCFALLFLSRSTGKVLKRTTPEESHGGGLLTGGKGEPAEVVAAKKEPTPLDMLLKSLQDPAALDLEQAQSELIEQVQLGDRTELIGQKATLVKLIQHPHGEVRRTAAWALGRTNDLHLARYLIDALEDQDLGVMMEAHAALSWLSRRFDGYGLPVNPLDEIGENASEEEKQTAIQGWRVRARRNWGDWYLRVRPYADRGDEFEAALRQRLGEK